MQTINRVYDQYREQDYSYGDSDLNPMREIALDNIDRVSNKIQEITEAILQKKLQPKTTPKVDVTLNTESNPNDITFDEKIRLLKTGTDGKELFPQLPETIRSLNDFLASLPADLREQLEGPISIDCEEVLKQYDFSDASDELEDLLAEIQTNSTSNTQEPDGTKTKTITKEPDGTKVPTPKTTKEGKTGSSSDDCEMMELWYLKYLLIISKVLKILRIIIDMVFSIISPILQIVSWAIGAWLDPPNIACIAQYLVEIIVSLLVMLVGMLIQYIWNLLNLDCITDQSTKAIAEIRKALQAFNNAMGMINPGAVNLLAKEITTNVIDPIKIIIDQIKDKGDEWEKFRDDLAEMMNPEEVSKQLKKMEEEITSKVKAELSNNENALKAKKVYNQAKSLYNNEIKDLAKSTKGLKEIYDKSKEFVLMPTTIKETATYKLMSKKVRSLTLKEAPKEPTLEDMLADATSTVSDLGEIADTVKEVTGDE